MCIAHKKGACNDIYWNDAERGISWKFFIFQCFNFQLFFVSITQAHTNWKKPTQIKFNGQIKYFETGQKDFKTFFPQILLTIKFILFWVNNNSNNNNNILLNYKH